MDTWLGHSVLQVPVPQLEGWVRDRARHHDDGWVSTDPAFGHAHVTALGPWLPGPDSGDLDVVAALAAATAPFAFVLDDVTAFPDGLVHARPRPDDGFRDLTMRLTAAFPQCPPYDGRYDEVVPHLTLDSCSGDVTVASTRAALGDLLPADCRAETLQLAWYEAGACRVLASWSLAGPLSADSRLPPS